ncbi:MAG: hypothetical protein KKA79_08525, partial [Nanoarchaeota archaeon]|nr:hypothetical protein [Nanoarchaeota archaeon]
MVLISNKILRTIGLWPGLVFFSVSLKAVIDQKKDGNKQGGFRWTSERTQKAADALAEYFKRTGERLSKSQLAGLMKCNRMTIQHHYPEIIEKLKASSEIDFKTFQNTRRGYPLVGKTGFKNITILTSRGVKENLYEEERKPIKVPDWLQPAVEAVLKKKRHNKLLPSLESGKYELRPFFIWFEEFGPMSILDLIWTGKVPGEHLESLIKLAEPEDIKLHSSEMNQESCFLYLNKATELIGKISTSSIYNEKFIERYGEIIDGRAAMSLRNVNMLRRKLARTIFTYEIVENLKRNGLDLPSHKISLQKVNNWLKNIISYIDYHRWEENFGKVNLCSEGIFFGENSPVYTDLYWYAKLINEIKFQQQIKKTWVPFSKEYIKTLYHRESMLKIARAFSPQTSGLKYYEVTKIRAMFKYFFDTLPSNIRPPVIRKVKLLRTTLEGPDYYCTPQFAEWFEEVSSTRKFYETKEVKKNIERFKAIVNTLDKKVLEGVLENDISELHPNNVEQKDKRAIYYYILLLKQGNEEAARRLIAHFKPFIQIITHKTVEGFPDVDKNTIMGTVTRCLYKTLMNFCLVKPGTEEKYKDIITDETDILEGWKILNIQHLYGGIYNTTKYWALRYTENEIPHFSSLGEQFKDSGNRDISLLIAPHTIDIEKMLSKDEQFVFQRLFINPTEKDWEECVKRFGSEETVIKIYEIIERKLQNYLSSSKRDNRTNSAKSLGTGTPAAKLSTGDFVERFKDQLYYDLKDRRYKLNHPETAP